MMVFEAWDLSIRLLACLIIYLGKNKFFKKRKKRRERERGNEN